VAESRLEAVARVYEGWKEGDFTTGVRLFDEYAMLIIRPEFPESGYYVGPTAIRDYMRAFLEAWERVTQTPESLAENGDTVLAKVHQEGVGQGSGIPVEMTFFQTWSFRGEKVIRLEMIMDERDALAAVGREG
jgi:ketosteroid isomerase-like protein